MAIGEGDKLAGDIVLYFFIGLGIGTISAFFFYMVRREKPFLQTE